jgi:hypothetical protein
VNKLWIPAVALAAAVLWGVSLSRAHAQVVYKCDARTYSEAPCSARVVRTYEAPVAINPKPKDIATRRLPGETVAEFNTRRHRSGMSESDRDECARLDKRIPVERARLTGPAEEDIDDAQRALAESRKRFTQLRC